MINMTDRELNEAIFIRVRIEENEGDGLFFATSPDMDSLFVAERDMPALIREVPEVIRALLKAELKHDFEIWRTRVPEPEDRAWVAIPTHLAAEALHAP